MTKFGTRTHGELVHKGIDRSGKYNEFTISTDPRYAPTRFSAVLGSDLARKLETLSIGSYVVVHTSAPRLATSKAGNPYLNWFAIDVEVEDVSDTSEDEV